MDAVGTTRAHNCQTEESFWKENAELLVYLVNGEQDIYIGVHPRTCPAESFRLHRDS